LCAEVHVWMIDLAGAAEIGAALGLLSADERDRAGRFRFDRDRRAFILTRAALRVMLGRYLGAPPEGIRFVYGNRGKPALAGRGALLQFNVSHSGNRAALAFTAGCEVGIDVEQIRAMPDVVAIAERYFSAEERADLARVERAARTAAFFRCWTRKEAYIKATGEGLSAPLDGFQVTLEPGAGARFVHVRGDRSEATAWQLRDLEPGSGYAAALAIRDAARTIRMRPLIGASEALAHNVQ
jgi:4'-phosphopantetheinyl transferase